LRPTISWRCSGATSLHPLLPYLAEVAVALADTRRAAILYRSLLPFAGRNMGLGPHVIFGPASHALGVLAFHLGQWEDAERHFQNAIDEATRAQGPAWLAAIQCDYGAALRERGETRTRRAAARRAAQAAADRLGLGPLRARLATLERIAVPQREAARAVVGGGENARVVVSPGRDPAAGRVLHFPVKPGARPACGRRGRRMGSSAARASTGPSASAPTWSDCAIRAALRYLAALLRPAERRGARVDVGRRRTGARRRRAPLPPKPRRGKAGLAVDEAGEAHELLDEQARAAYKGQLEDLREQLAEAEAFNDQARAAALAREIEFLSRELARAVGLHGRARPGSTRAERAPPECHARDPLRHPPHRRRQPRPRPLLRHHHQHRRVLFLPARSARPGDLDLLRRGDSRKEPIQPRITRIKTRITRIFLCKGCIRVILLLSA
jgi:tetratricopeptide (TPR) repeat protein